MHGMVTGVAGSQHWRVDVTVNGNAMKSTHLYQWVNLIAYLGEKLDN